jgi:hypothetical protein
MTAQVIKSAKNISIPTLELIKPKEPKLTSTSLNHWVKNLGALEKEIFYDKIWNNDLLWEHRSLEQRKLMFNNYRFIETLKRPKTFDCLLIYISALYVDPELHLQTLFPALQNDDAAVLVPLLYKASLETNNFNRQNVKDKTKQDYG